MNKTDEKQTENSKSPLSIFVDYVCHIQNSLSKTAKFPDCMDAFLKPLIIECPKEIKCMESTTFLRCMQRQPPDSHYVFYILCLIYLYWNMQRQSHKIELRKILFSFKTRSINTFRIIYQKTDNDMTWVFWYKIPKDIYQHNNYRVFIQAITKSKKTITLTPKKYFKDDNNLNDKWLSEYFHLMIILIHRKIFNKIIIKNILNKI